MSILNVKSRVFKVTLVILIVCQLSPNCFADLVLYRLPGSRAAIVIEGSGKVLPGRMVSLNHDFGKLGFSLDNCEFIESPTKSERFHRLFNSAKSSKDIDKLFEAARLGLRSGMIEGFYSCLSEVWKIDPQNETIKRLVKAQKEIKNPKFPTKEEDEARFRDLVDRHDLNVSFSTHYILLHDIQDEPKKRGELSRPEKRLKLLEEVYSSFYLKFALEGFPLEQPKERLMVMLFGHENDYMHYVNLLDPALKNASGFWDPRNNVAVFYDQSTTESLLLLREFSDELKASKAEVKRSSDRTTSRDFAQFANTIDVLTSIAESEADIEVVSHEATHQLAGNSGLLPRDSIFLRWAQEGLASYFETPSGSGWGGIGAVNEQRLDWYRALAKDIEHSNVEFIVTDKVFDFAGNLSTEVAAYGQAWSLTHFMMEKNFADYMKFFERLRKLDPELSIEGKQEQVLAAFNETCGKNGRLENEWRFYMQNMKSDLEQTLAKHDKK